MPTETEFGGENAMAGNAKDDAEQVTETSDLLSHPLRRRLLLELSNHDNPVHLDSLVDAVTGSETPGAATGHDSIADPDAVRLELHHSHLPKLAAAGWIEYDPENQTIRYESRIEAIRSALQTAVDELDRIRAAYDERSQRLDSR